MYAVELNTIWCDFNQELNAIWCDCCNKNLNDLDTLFRYLSAIYETRLYPQESVIIFDEVQFCPRARAAIKYLVADGRYSYIETGSLMSIRENVRDILIPSEERHIKMFPMDFEEFLWALGNDTLMDFISDSYNRKYMKKFSEQLDIPIILHTADLSEKDGILFLPVYMTGLL